jgi:hypothetical protein
LQQGLGADGELVRGDRLQRRIVREAAPDIYFWVLEKMGHPPQTMRWKIQNSLLQSCGRHQLSSSSTAIRATRISQVLRRCRLFGHQAASTANRLPLPKQQISV